MEGKVALVTGAGRGVGAAVAECLAAEGARVMVNDLGCSPEGEGSDPEPARQVVERIREAGGEAEANVASVTDAEAARALVDETVQRFGRLDALINVAGIGGDVPLHRLEPEAFRRALDAQLVGAYHCLRAAAQVMKSAREGSIVNTTGVTGLQGNWGQAHLAAAGAGVIGLTRSASIELQRYGVRVNAVAPIAKTRLTESLPMFEQVDSMQPVHVAPAYVFLASDSSRDVTGIVLVAAGGKLSVQRLTESPGVLKEADEGLWTAAEIAEHWPAISRR